MSVYDELTETQQFASRVIADHARSTAFAIADGILPGNEGRNYVLRKIMRRAIYHGREHLGLNDLFFYKVCDFVVSEMKGVYPELETQRDFIGKMVRIEEERFGNTVTVGLGKLNELGISGSTPQDDDLFLSIGKLYDTFGTPRDLIRVYLEEKGLEFEEDDFNERFDSALQDLQSQGTVGQTTRKSQPSPVYAELLEKVGVNQFHGYDTTHLTGAKVVGILDGETSVETLAEGQQGSVVLDQTPFYAEAGGQVGDVGKLIAADSTAAVADTYSPVAGLIIHKVTVENGSLNVGDEVTASVNAEKRDATRRNHTATHLVHAALREVLGTHVKQAGSVVGPNVLRFDFTHYQPMTTAEIAEVEDLVNREILKNDTVNTNVMSIEEAMSGGAMALFGEKYGSAVRVLSVGDGGFSKELCGGTHVRATGDIGSFKITGDEAIASGVRRIRAITGFDAFNRFREDERLIDASLGALNTQRDNLPNAIARLQEELKKTRKEMDELKLKIATGSIGDASSGGDEHREINGVKVLGKIVEGLDSGGTRQLSDTLLARLKSGVVIIGRSDEGKVGIIVRVSDDLTSQVKAGDIIREIAPIVGGRGGGKPDMAEGGGTEPAKLADAIETSYAVIERMLS
ncbi:MAG: alanine--tRNA ligase [Pyrinomonadaceae bacterium]|nr:alanine--tRNA ligase [Acidobacteriota bacterium]MBP7376141.1 alanine--tRNA ligase [Pyrinomonadaceae bacterium]